MTDVLQFHRWCGASARCLALLTACLGTLAAGRAQTPDPKVNPNYELTIGDVVEITVFQEADLAASQRIDNQGQVRLPLLENVTLAGKTVRQAETYLQDQFVERKFLKHPMVTLRVAEYAPREVLVFGAVANAGAVEFPKEKSQLDIVDVISRCGGFTPAAKSDAVKVSRKNPDGSTDIKIVNVQAMISPKRSQVEQVFVHPGDIINVDEVIF